MFGLTDDLVTFNPSLTLALRGAVPGFVALPARGELLLRLRLGPTLRAHGGLIALESAAATLAPKVEGLEKPGATQHSGQGGVNVGDNNLQEKKREM